MNTLVIVGIIFGILGFALFVWLLIKFLILCLDVKENRNTLTQIKNWCTEAQKAIEEINAKLDEQAKKD